MKIQLTDTNPDFHHQRAQRIQAFEFLFVFSIKKEKKRKEKHAWPQCLSVPFISGQANKGILFVAVQDVNLFWLVVSL